MCDRRFEQIAAAVARQGLAPAKRALWLVARGAWLPVLLVLSCLLYKRRLRWRSVSLGRDAKVDAAARLSHVASRVQRLRFNPSRTLPVTMVRERLQPHSVAPRPPSSNLNPEAWCGVSCRCCAWLGLPVLMHVILGRADPRRTACPFRQLLCPHDAGQTAGSVDTAIKALLAGRDKLDETPQQPGSAMHHDADAGFLYQVSINAIVQVR